MLHPTRLSLSTSGATPQAAQAPGMGKKGLEGLDCTQHDGVYAWGVGSTRAAVRVEGVRWLRSPPHMRASPVTGHAEPDR
jgi:hypothetical protein